MSLWIQQWTYGISGNHFDPLSCWLAMMPKPLTSPFSFSVYLHIHFSVLSYIKCSVFKASNLLICISQKKVDFLASTCHDSRLSFPTHFLLLFEESFTCVSSLPAQTLMLNLNFSLQNDGSFFNEI